MSLKVYLIAAAATLSLSVPAILVCTTTATAAPILSGKYIVTDREFCQPILTADFAVSGGDPQNGIFVDALKFTDNLNYSSQQLIAATFNPSKGKITVSGFQDKGSVFLLTVTGTGHSGTQGETLNESQTSGSIPYSNTDTTFSVNGFEYHAFYGQIDKNGIAHTMSWMGVFTEGNPSTPCSNQGEATRQ